MYIPQVAAYPAYDRGYERDQARAEAAEDRLAIIDEGTVAEAAELDRTIYASPIRDALEYLSWLLNPDRHEAVGLSAYDRMTLADFKALCRARGLDLTELETALSDHVTNQY